MAIKIIVSNKNFNGERGGFTFRQGVAIVEDEAKGRALANSFGYEIEEIKDEKKEEAKAEAPKKASRKKAKKDEE
jgi:hypothetical protein